MIILVMGLPGSGKTTFAANLVASLSYSAEWLNADTIREKYNDWDFSYEGRIRQVKRMKELASENSLTVIDMVCPLQEMRYILNPDIIVLMDTIECSVYEDTNQMFDKKCNPTYNIKKWSQNNKVIEEITKSVFNKKRSF